MLFDDPTTDPLLLAQEYWPHVNFYDKQRLVIKSVWEDDETYVPAGNKLGKDFVAAFITLAFFLTRSPCRIVTTSVTDGHLDVLWGEIDRFIETCTIPLRVEESGGFLQVTQRQIRRVDPVTKVEEPISYVKGMVSLKGEKLQGHHASDANDPRDPSFDPLTLFVCDEASGADDNHYRMTRTWAHRMLIFGNCWPCENYFKYAVKGKLGTKNKGGDVKRSVKQPGFRRRIVKIKAVDSPNVEYGMLEVEKGLTPSNKILTAGVKTYNEYIADLNDLEVNDRTVILDADWYEGKDVKLYPSDWLNRAENLCVVGWRAENGFEPFPRRRVGLAMGVDSGEGKSATCWAIVDNHGIIDLISKKTPDTSIITGETLALMREYKIEPQNVLFDRGGGGFQHANVLRDKGFNVRTVAFGGSVGNDDFRNLHNPIAKRLDLAESKYAYKNRRAQMYGIIRLLLNPELNPRGFAISRNYTELRRQLTPIPFWRDEEGRMFLPPKQRRPDVQKQSNSKTTMQDLIGCSPDEADALALACYGLVAPIAVAMITAEY